MDLRAEPIVLCVPRVEKGRYYAVQLVDMYTFNYGYIGSRTTGNGAGCYMVAGPDWRAKHPSASRRFSGARHSSPWQATGRRRRERNWLGGGTDTRRGRRATLDFRPRAGAAR
jgi:hypothetical protein